MTKDLITGRSGRNDGNQVTRLGKDWTKMGITLEEMRTGPTNMPEVYKREGTGQDREAPMGETRGNDQRKNGREVRRA